MDILHKLLKWIDYNRYKAGAVVAVSFACVWLFACAPKTPSLNDPATSITRQELNLETIAKEAEFKARADALKTEVAAYNTAKASAYEDLTAKEQFRATVIDAVGGLVISAAQGTPLNLVSIFSTVLLLAAGGVGVGSYADKKRTDKVLADVKARKTTA